ncbi:hypothetical protein F4604DRAFT_1750425 [Suillus subluteus]|nr:hypothetical protein F4604DRAFT_1750425 [Suillus subluteus]
MGSLLVLLLICNVSSTKCLDLRETDAYMLDATVTCQVARLNKGLLLEGSQDAVILRNREPDIMLMFKVYRLSILAIRPYHSRLCSKRVALGGEGAFNSGIRYQQMSGAILIVKN